MTDKKKSFLKHAAIYGLGTFSMQIASIILLPIYTRHLVPSEYGTLQLLYRVGEIFNICLMVNGVRLATISLFGRSRNEHDKQHLAATVTTFVVAVMAVAALIVVFSAETFSSFLGINNRSLVVAGIVTITFQAMTVTPLALMQARVESTLFVLCSLGMSICQITLAVITVVFWDWGIWGVISSLACTYLLFGIGMTTRELVRSSWRPDWRQFKEVVRFAGPFIPSGFCFFLLQSGDQFFLAKFAGASVLGVYAFGYKIASAVVMFASQPLRQVWNARMYDAYRLPDRSQVFGAMATRIMSAYLFVGTGLLLFQDDIFAVLGSSDFAAAAALVGPLVLAHFFLVLSYLFDAAFYVTGHTNRKPWIAAASTVVMLTAYALLIPRYQAMGAAWATAIGFLGHSAFTYFVAQRSFYVKYEFGRLFTVLALSIGGSLLGSLLLERSVALKIMLWFSLPAILWALGFITGEEKQYIAQCVSALRRFRMIGSTRLFQQPR